MSGMDRASSPESAEQYENDAGLGPKGGGKKVLYLPEPIYTSGQAARLLDIPARTMRRFLAVGRIVGEKNQVTGTWQISREDLVLFALENGFAVDKEPEIIRFLVVHHDPKIVRRLIDYLENTVVNCHIEHTEDPCNALLRLGDQTPDILFISPTMPILRGHEMLACLRSYPKTKKVKIIGLSSMSESLGQFRSSGADAVLETPFTKDVLLDVLSGLLPRAALRGVEGA